MRLHLLRFLSGMRNVIADDTVHAQKAKTENKPMNEHQEHNSNNR